MSLPTIPLPTRVIDLGGGAEVTIRGLSRAEARHLSTAFKDGSESGDVDGAEVWLLVTVLGVSDAEAQLWREQTDAVTVGKVVDGIIELSGMGEPSPKAATNGS